MKIRWVPFLLSLCAVAICSSGKAKRKKQASSPHVTHVDSRVQKPVGRNSRIFGSSPADLSNLIISTEKKGFSKLKSFLRRQLKSGKMSFKAIRRVYKKNVKLLSEKKRRRVMRKLKHEIAVLKRIAIKLRKPCKSTKDCGINECCIFRYHDSSKYKRRIGHCKMRPKLNQRCKLSLLPGLDTECPCQGGLTCEIPRTTSPGQRPKPRCEHVKYHEDELDAQAITGLGQ